MKSMISECAETIYKTYEELMEQYYNARLFFGSYIISRLKISCLFLYIFN